MKEKQVTMYYCEVCKRRGTIKSLAEKHEAKCLEKLRKKNSADKHK